MTKTTELIQMLSHIPIFSRINEAILRSLIKNVDLVRLSPKQHLFSMDDPATYFYLVVAGSITLYRPSYAGDNKIFRTVEGGDLLVETVMFLESPYYPLSAQAVGNATCYRIPRENLLQLCQESPVFSMAMLSGMAERISQSLNRIDLLTMGSAAQRLVLYLLDLRIQQCRNWLRLPVSQNILARQLNITPETLSRHMRTFRRNGLIGQQSPEVVLLNVDALCRSVNLPPPDQRDLARNSAARRLGSGLFDCCNYAGQTLGWTVSRVDNQ